MNDLTMLLIVFSVAVVSIMSGIFFGLVQLLIHGILKPLFRPILLTIKKNIVVDVELNQDTCVVDDVYIHMSDESLSVFIRDKQPSIYSRSIKKINRRFMEKYRIIYKNDIFFIETDKKRYKLNLT